MVVAVICVIELRTRWMNGWINEIMFDDWMDASSGGKDV